MLCLKLLCSLLVLGLAVGAPSDMDTAQAKKRVERNRRQLGVGDVDATKLDLENYGPLKIVEKSLEEKDGEGSNEINGTKKIDDKSIEYYHRKNKGTVKTIVEEKARDGTKMENVFYHLSYEKDTDAPVDDGWRAGPEETTRDTTDQTLPEDEETATTDDDNNDKYNANTDQDDATNNPDDTMTDAPIPLEENPHQPDYPNDQAINDDTPPQMNAADNAGWFNNWFNWIGQETTEIPEVTDPVDTPHLDEAIMAQSQQFTFLTPFFLGSVGLKSPECPAHRPTQISVYFFSFCV
ncbi:hypothetical protein M8J75_006556 [Diaphorina citri]|nr:hypothetical protein M8J75_006556 [Diaphorina citri]KAI5728514.1 hypothetical protein M8J77_017241 [Diaphorina citri]